MATIKDTFSKFSHLRVLLIFSLSTFFSLPVTVCADDFNRPKISEYKADVFSEHSAVVLRREVTLDIDQAGAATQRNYLVIRLNDESAVKDYSQIDLSNNSFASDLSIDIARVHNGEQIQDLKEDAVTRQNLSSENFLIDDERLIFSLPTLREGSVIELQYTRKSKRPIIPNEYQGQLGFYWLESRAGNVGTRLDPVFKSIVNITYPASMNMDYRQSKLITEKPQHVESHTTKSLQWIVSNLPPIKPENWMPEDLGLYPVIYVSSVADWGVLNKWAYDLFEPHIDEGEKVNEIARNIERIAMSDEEKVRAVFDYMEENVRYVYAHVGRNGYEPHDAAEVLVNGYGDCKDQAVLAVSILRALGIPAYPALLAANGDKLIQGLPINYFDHMLVYIPPKMNRDAIWLDTSSTKIDYPGIHWTHEGKPALVLNEFGNQMIEVKSIDIVQHGIQIDLTFDSSNSSDVVIDFEGIFFGFLGQNVAAILNFAPDREVLLKEILGPVYPKAKLSDVSYQKIEDRKDSYKLAGKFRVKNIWKGVPEPLNISSGLSQFIGLSTNMNAIDEPSKRTQPFQTGLPFEINLKMHMRHPGGDYAPITIVSGSDYESKYFSVLQNGYASANGDFIVESKLTTKQLTVPLDEYENYYRATQNLMEMPNWHISYQIDENALALAKLNRSGNSMSFRDILNNAEIYLKNGDFAQALELANKAINIDGNSAEAHYLRGVALGYQQEFEASNLAFAKALELGYEL